MTKIISTRQSLVPQKSESEALQKQLLERLAELLAEFQAMTRQMSEYEATIWIKSLSSCRLEDIERAMQDFVETATRDEARGVTLGEINRRIEGLVDRRNEVSGQNRSCIEQWKAEQDAEIARDPEGFEKARKEAQAKFRKMFGKPLEQVVKESATEESQRAIKAGEIVDQMQAER